MPIFPHKSTMYTKTKGNKNELNRGEIWEVYRKVAFPDQYLNSTMAAATVQKTSRPLTLCPRFLIEDKNDI